MSVVGGRHWYRSRLLSLGAYCLANSPDHHHGLPSVSSWGVSPYSSLCRERRITSVNSFKTKIRTTLLGAVKINPSLGNILNTSTVHKKKSISTVLNSLSRRKENIGLIIRFAFVPQFEEYAYVCFSYKSPDGKNKSDQQRASKRRQFKIKAQIHQRKIQRDIDQSRDKGISTRLFERFYFRCSHDSSLGTNAVTKAAGKTITAAP